MKNLWCFLKGTIVLVFTGSIAYYAWLLLLLSLMTVGAVFYVNQLDQGLILTGMNDSVSWGFYISNFTFLVGVAAAAVLLVIPAYVYHWKPIKEIALIGELLAVSAIVMCLLFVTVDIGHPERFWHLIPKLGLLNWPQSMLAWDVVVLNTYLALNATIAAYYLYSLYNKRHPNTKITTPLLLISIPAAISIHTVTAFLYNGLGARPFWNASILVPRFLASAFSSGPALIILVFFIVRRYTKFRIKDKAIQKIAEIMAYAMFINLLLLGAEVFKEFYTDSVHVAPVKYLFLGLHGHNDLVPFIWTAIVCNTLAFIIFLNPGTRKNNFILGIGCVLIFTGVYIEKGMGLVIPGLVPDTLHEIVEYTVSQTERWLAVGIWATGFFVFTILLRIAIPILNGDFHIGTDGRSSVISDKRFLFRQKHDYHSDQDDDESEHAHHH